MRRGWQLFIKQKQDLKNTATEILNIPTNRVTKHRKKNSLLCSSVTEKLRKRNPKRIYRMTQYIYLTHAAATEAKEILFGSDEKPGVGYL